MTPIDEYKFNLYSNYEELDAATRISRAVSQIMNHPSFCLVYLILNIGKLEIVPANHRIKTAATNGRDIFFNEAFIMTLDEYEVNFLVLHEAGHILFTHLTTYRYLHNIDALRSNKAMDYVTNGWIVDTDPNGVFARMPGCGLYKDEYSNLSAKEIFDLLEEEQRPQKPRGDKPCEEGEGEGEGEGDAESDGEGDAESDGKGKGGGKPEAGNGSGDAGLDSHDWDGAEAMSPEEQAALDDAVDHAIREGSLLVGKAKGNVSRNITNTLIPKIDWREVLREFITSTIKGKDTYTWRQFNRRYVTQDVYLPSSISHRPKEVVIAQDVSGSMSDDDRAACLAETIKIVDSVKPEIVRILWWDAVVQKEQIIRSDKSSRVSTLSTGGGGTRMGCVSDYLIANNIKPECVIVFSDGAVESNVKWQVTSPSMFVIGGAYCNKQFKAPAGGRVIFN
jgi:predicted metal-dependent peptidase